MSLAIDSGARTRTYAQAPTPQPSASPTTPPTPRVYGPFAPGHTSQPAQPNPVDHAKKVVDEKLDESGFLNDVTHDELRDISEEFKRLTPEQRSDLVSQMSEPQLKTWADEAGSNGILGTGGLDREEKQALFQNLAEGLSGPQLARLSKAFHGETDAKALGDAIAAHAGNPAKLEFVKAVAGQVESDPQVAVQVAKAIGGLKGDTAAVDAAFGALSDSQLTAVVKAAKQEWVYTNIGPYGGGSVTVSYDVAPLAALIGAASTGSNAEVKAKVFEYAGKELKTIAGTNTGLGIAVMKKGAEETLTKAMSELLTSDTNGVMRELEQDFREGRGITTFTEQMVRQGRNDELKVIIDQLKVGNDGNGNEIQRFESREGSDNERNAQTLGYFVGSIYAGVGAINRDIDKQAGMVKAIFAASLSGGKDVAGMWLSTAAKGAVGALVATVGATGVLATDQIARDMKAGNKDLREGLAELAFPRLPSGQKYEGEEAETAYDAAVSRVIDANSP